MPLRRRLATLVALLPLMSQVFTGQAQAAGKPLPHVTMVRARASMPLEMTSLPLSQARLSYSRTQTTWAGCHAASIPFHNWGEADALYRWDSPPKGIDLYTEVYLFTTVYVFRTVAQAATVGGRMTANGLSCARTGGFGPTTSRWHYRTTLQEPYTTGAWHGYRSVEHATLSLGRVGQLKNRIFTSWLTRGNVVVSVEEEVTDNPGAGPVQQAWWEHAQQHVLTALSN
jgi:hypothetical protein